jgi:hypothetical protein
LRLARIAGQVDQHVRDVHEHRRLDVLGRLRVMLLVMAAEEQEIGGRAAAEHGEQANDHHDQLEFVLGLRADLVGLAAAFCFVLCHSRPVRLRR